jgi:hypothetical protein
MLSQTSVSVRHACVDNLTEKKVPIFNELSGMATSVPIVC